MDAHIQIIEIAAIPAVINVVMFRAATGRLLWQAVVVFPVMWVLIAAGIVTSNTALHPILLGVLWSVGMGLLLGLAEMITVLTEVSKQSSSPTTRFAQVMIFQLVGGIIIGGIAWAVFVFLG